MFMRLSRLMNPNGAQTLAQLHPLELHLLMEQAWNQRANAGALGGPTHRSDLPGLAVAQPQLQNPPVPAGFSAAGAAAWNAMGRILQPAIWDHLVYAYMIENTRIYEIFRRVLQEFAHGEKLGIATPATQLWLRATEEVFYRDVPPFAITSVNSFIRPDLRASRRNAYHRMFGMELNHGTDDGSTLPYPKAAAANGEFVTTLEELLREVAIGIANVNNAAGVNPTDNAKITHLANSLHDMLLARRRQGMLSREEFFFVAAMSWFHMTVSVDVPIVVELRANGVSPEQRLFAIAQGVGLPAHGLSRAYFQIAEPLSQVLLAIESGALNAAGTAPLFYNPALAGNLAALMNDIIADWSTITGRDMKARKVATV
jgi:hypothetical protein